MTRKQLYVEVAERLNTTQPQAKNIIEAVFGVIYDLDEGDSVNLNNLGESGFNIGVFERRIKEKHVKKTYLNNMSSMVDVPEKTWIALKPKREETL